jgi:hypothetical protein
MERGLSKNNSTVRMVLECFAIHAVGPVCTTWTYIFLATVQAKDGGLFVSGPSPAYTQGISSFPCDLLICNRSQTYLQRISCRKIELTNPERQKLHLSFNNI